jgi:DNA-binding PadR family transcriptional regulator
MIYDKTKFKGRKHMANINTTQYALLGMLSFMPMSGYDIKKFTDMSISYFWSENYGHIYPVLKKLEENGLVVKQIEHGEGKPDKKVYSITRDGQQALKEWLAAPVQKEIYRLEILLKLFFGYWTETNNMIEKISLYKESAEKTLNKLLDIENHIKEEQHEHFKDKPPYMKLCLNYGKHFYNMVIRWCEETLNILEKSKGEKK